MYRRLLNIFLLLCISISSHALDATIRFIPTFNGEELKLDKYYHLPDGDSIVFSTFKCYISNMIFFGWDKSVIPEKNSYHLLNIEEPETMIVTVHNVKAVNGIEFSIGIDSQVSVSGAMGGALDPTNGMYWSWQSGYINFKIEGEQTKVPARNHEFQYHVGGYAGKDKAVQKIILSKSSTKELRISIALDKFISGLDMSKQYSVMIPGQEAVQLAKRFAGCFQIMQP